MITCIDSFFGHNVQGGRQQQIRADFQIKFNKSMQKRKDKRCGFSLNGMLMHTRMRLPRRMLLPQQTPKLRVSLLNELYFLSTSRNIDHLPAWMTWDF